MPTRKLPPEIRDLRKAFRAFLLSAIGKCEHPKCSIPGVQNGLIIHEALVPVNWMTKNRKDKENELLKLLLFHPTNVLVLHNTPCHLDNCPSRETALEIVAQRSDNIYTQFQLSNHRYAIAHFYECFEVLQQKGIIKTLPGKPANYQQMVTAKIITL